jgi:monooxygenase
MVTGYLPSRSASIKMETMSTTIDTIAKSETTKRAEHIDVVVVGAGVSGVSAAYHLQKNCPTKKYVILEGREQMGGTWDLFRYPGIRSDSDMHTFGFSFRPWTEAKAIADGPSILRYVKETAELYGIDKKIRFRHRVESARWSTEKALWTLTISRAGTHDIGDGAATERIEITCNFLHLCAGYYKYDAGFMPEYKDADLFAGEIVHPQKWTNDVDYANKRVVVIGSGATAVTLIPELAKTAKQVTMLQRSPTYMASRPAEDPFANAMRKYLPTKVAYSITRWKNVLGGMFFFKLCRTRPAKVKAKMIDLVRNELGPSYDVATHFTPKYNPWDQRICIVPESDFFKAISSGRADVVTDQIDSFTEKGIRLKSGRELEADLIVSATGLNLQLLGGLELEVDDKRADVSKCLQYKGMMFSGIPNLSSCFGYTNASWTLKADLTSAYLTRLLNHLDEKHQKICTPLASDPTMDTEPFVDFSSSYFQRSIDTLPKQGTKKPWRLNQNYALDVMTLRFGSVEDSEMKFSNPVVRSQRSEPVYS